MPSEKKMKTFQNPSPPRLAVWLVKRLERYQTNHAIVDDMQEVFTMICQRQGFIPACLWYWSQSLDAVIKNRIFNLKWRFIMYKNYFLTAWRNIKKHKGYSFINISGLAVGMACFILIFLWIRHELSYDKYHQKTDQIYRTCIYSNFSGNEFYSAQTPAPLSPALLEEFPEVTHATRLLKVQRDIQWNEENTVEKRFYYADPSIFDVFTIPLLQGDPQHALDQPNSVIITESTAKKYFKNANPIGKILKVNNEKFYQITGVAEDVPSSSHFHFDFLTSISSLQRIHENRDNWDESFLYTYFVLDDNASPEQLEAKFPQMVEKYIGPDIQAAFGMSVKEWSEKSGNSFRYYVQRLKDIHLRSNLMGEIEANGDIRYVYIFLIVGLMTLLIACINFINLATARSMSRAKDVGIRKVLGADKPKLISQFLIDSIVLSLLAFVLAMILVNVFLPFLNQISGKDLTLNILDKPDLMGCLLGVIVIVGILAGSYPAFYLASFHPMGVLRGKILQGAKSSKARKGLVLFQFSITITILICSVVIHKQLFYMENKKLGFHEDQVLVISHADALGNQIDAFKREIERNHHIIRSSASSSIPGDEFSSHSISHEGASLEKRNVVTYLLTDNDFLETYGLELKEGRSFSHDLSTDKEAVVVNESAVKSLGFKKPIGKKIGTVTLNRTIIGVVKDFHFSSVREKIGPLAIYRTDHGWNSISVRIQPEDISKSIPFLKRQWEKFVQNEPFDFYFLDEKMNQLYSFEHKIGQLSSIFSFLAVGIACLGLFGLASFTAERCTKEIGIRKVFGASVVNIVIMQSKEFTKWVLAANVAAWPLAFYLMKNWLQNYAYRADLSIWIFVMSAAGTYLIALLTVSYQSIKSAMANPIHSIRNE
jgi:putative ABC transport system permease protein